MFVVLTLCVVILKEDTSVCACRVTSEETTPVLVRTSCVFWVKFKSNSLYQNATSLKETLDHQEQHPYFVINPLSKVLSIVITTPQTTSLSGDVQSLRPHLLSIS